MQDILVHLQKRAVEDQKEKVRHVKAKKRDKDRNRDHARNHHEGALAVMRPLCKAIFPCQTPRTQEYKITSPLPSAASFDAACAGSIGEFIQFHCLTYL